MAKIDLFAPPTDDELQAVGAKDASPSDSSSSDLFAPPSEDELKALEGPSMAESAARGVAQGATLGFADEITGAGEASLEKAKQSLGLSNMPNQDFADMYRKFRDESRANYDKAQEANPISYGAGEVGSMFLPGVGALGNIGKAAEGASLLRRLGSTAKLGAAIGLGTSKADLTKGEVGQAAADTGVGALTGAAVGSAAEAIPAAYKGITGAAGKAANYATKESVLASDIARARELGKQGISIGGKSGSEYAEKQLINASKDLQDSIFNKLDSNFSEKMKLFKDRPNETVNFSKLYQDTMQKVDDAVNAGEIVDPIEAENIKTALNRRFYEKMPEKVKGATKRKVEQVIDPDTGDVISEKTSRSFSRDEGVLTNPETSTNVTEGQTVSRPLSDPFVRSQFKNIEEVTDAVRQGVLKGEMTLEQAANFVRDFQRTASKIKGTEPVRSGIFKGSSSEASKAIEDVVPEIGPLNQSSTAAYDTLGELNVNPYTDKGSVTSEAANFVKNLDTQFNPTQRIKEDKVFGSLKEALGEDQANQMQSKLKQASQDFNLGKRAATGQGLSSISQLVGAFKDRIVHGANLGGKAESFIQKSAPVRAARSVAESLQSNILNMPSEMVEPLAQSLEQRGDTVSSALANQLRMITQAPDSGKRNALLFSIAQNPNYRNAIKETLGITEEEANK